MVLIENHKKVIFQLLFPVDLNCNFQTNPQNCAFFFYKTTTLRNSATIKTWWRLWILQIHIRLAYSKVNSVRVCNKCFVFFNIIFCLISLRCDISHCIFRTPMENACTHTCTEKNWKTFLCAVVRFSPIASPSYYNIMHFSYTIYNLLSAYSGSTW